MNVGATKRTVFSPESFSAGLITAGMASRALFIGLRKGSQRVPGKKLPTNRESTSRAVLEGNQHIQKTTRWMIVTFRLHAQLIHRSTCSSSQYRLNNIREHENKLSWSLSASEANAPGWLGQRAGKGSLPTSGCSLCSAT